MKKKNDYSHESAKILFFDIETTHLKADFGTVLCIGYKWLGKPKVYVPAITEYESWDRDKTDDSGLVSDFLQVYESADMVVSYFGKGFDTKFLNAKLMEASGRLLPNTPHVDLFYTVKANLALSRKSLENVGYFLGLSQEKTKVEGKIWRRAATGHGPSVNYIVRHCRADVLLLEEAYLKLRPLVRTHPRVSGTGPCRVCGSTRLHSRGIALSTTRGTRHRYQCQSCGAWETR